MLLFDTRDEMVRALLPAASAVAEIGVFRGEFAEVLWSTKPSKLLLVDPFEGHTVSGNADGNGVVAADLDYEFLRLYRRWLPHPEVELIRGYSPDALKDVETASLDAIYIDGDHSYAGCWRDLVAARRVVKPGGWIMGHDLEMNPAKTSHRYDFGVKKAVDTFCCALGLELHAKALDGCVSYALRLPSTGFQSSRGTQ